jgi:hypothetical protein
MIMAALAIYQAWIWVGVSIDKFLIDLGFRNIFNTNITPSGSLLASGCPSVLLHNNGGLNAVMD